MCIERVQGLEKIFVMSFTIMYLVHHVTVSGRDVNTVSPWNHHGIPGGIHVRAD